MPRSRLASPMSCPSRRPSSVLRDWARMLIPTHAQTKALSGKFYLTFEKDSGNAQMHICLNYPRTRGATESIWNPFPSTGFSTTVCRVSLGRLPGSQPSTRESRLVEAEDGKAPRAPGTPPGEAHTAQGTRVTSASAPLRRGTR